MNTYARNILFLFSFFLLGFFPVKALIIGPDLLAKCDNCGEEKALISIISGNTFGAVQWSDLYMEAPMLPSLSPIQRCNNCNSFFLIKKDGIRYSDDKSAQATDTGRMSFQEIKKAIYLLNDSTLSEDDEYRARLEILQRFNDNFRGTSEDDAETLNLVNQEDWEIHKDNVKRLVKLLDATNNAYIPLIAEFYREAKLFDETLNILVDFTPFDDMKNFTQLVKEKAQNKDFKVFIWEE